MIRQDILAIIDANCAGAWTFFVCSPKGRDALTEAGGESLPFNPGSLSTYWRTSDEKLGQKVYHALSDMNAQDEIDCHFADMSFEVAALNAEEMAIEHHRRALAARTADYFEPLFNEAIAARDKARITELLYQFPLIVEKSFIIDRLKYGPDRFEELREPGVTIDNWHRV
jgi:hypothetical protein